MPAPDVPPARSIGDAATVLPNSVGDAATVTGDATPDAPTLADAPAGFVIERELGRGGMGVVYLARQEGLNRPIALKMILGGGRAERKHLIRFLAEAEAVASVRHPNVVEVYQYGESGGRPFMALEFCPGGSLADVRTSAPTEPRTAAEVIAAIADGVGAAHAAGIVHRDLKPGNVLLTADGTPKVTDFGLAKRATAESELTKTNAVMGTPAYMAPEQAGGGTKFVGPPADVWALGVMLYELLAGERPFGGDDTWSVLAAVMKAEVAPLRKKAPAVPRDLELICLKCLSQDPRDRYPGAAELAADLRRFLAGEPVSVRPAGPVEKTLKWVKRNRPLAGALFAAVLALVVGAAVSAWQAVRASGEADRANGEATRAGAEADKARAAERVAEQRADDVTREKAQAERELARAEKLVYAGVITQAQTSWAEGKEGTAFMELNRCRLDYRGWEHDHLYDRYLHGQCVLRAHEESVVDVRWSPDGSRLASAGLDGTVRVWDALTGRSVCIAEASENFRSVVCWSPDGRRLASGARDGAVQVWDAATGREICRFPAHAANVRAIDWSPDGSRIASGAVHDPDVRVWDAATGRAVRTLVGHGEFVTSVCWSPDGTRLVSGASDNTVRVWDPAAGREIGRIEFNTPNSAVRDVCWSPDGTKLAISSGYTAGAWEWATGRQLFTLDHAGSRSGYVENVAWSPDGTRLATSRGEWVWVWDAASGREVRRLYGHAMQVEGVCWSPDGSRLATCSRDETVRVWVAAEEPAQLACVGHEKAITSVHWDARGGRLVSGSWDGTVRVWEAASGREVVRLEGHTGAVYGVCWSPDGSRLASAGSDKTLRIWDVATGRSLLTLEGHTDEVHSVCWSPDGSRLASASDDKSVRVWDATTGRQVRRLDGHTDKVGCVCWSPDGSRLASASDDKSVRVWDGTTGRQVRRLDGHTDKVGCVCWSPDGSRLASGSGDETIRVWDVTSGREAVALAGHSAPVDWLSWRSDGVRLASVSADRTLRVWDVVNFCPLATFEGIHDDTQGGAEGVCWNPAGTRLATGGHDNKVLLWDSSIGQPVTELAGHSGRVTGVAFDPGGRRLYSRDQNGQVRAWDLTGRAVPNAEPKMDLTFTEEAWSSDRKLSARGVNRVVRLRDEAKWIKYSAEQDRRLKTWAAVPDFHRAGAAEAEMVGDTFAAAFHLRRLTALAPDDPDVRLRLAALDRVAPPPRPAAARPIPPAQP